MQYVRISQDVDAILRKVKNQREDEDSSKPVYKNALVEEAVKGHFKAELWDE